MRAAAAHLLYHLDAAGRRKGHLPFADDDTRRWLEYRPRPRPGVCLADMDRAAYKAAQQLLATALSTHAYAQAVTVMAVEEVLDRAEGGHRERLATEYNVAVFGEPEADAFWGWRFEGHHISVTMTIKDGAVVPAPLFLGLNPATVSYRGHPVLRPLALEEELARALVTGLAPVERDRAVIAHVAPADIFSGTRPRASALEPAGLAVGALDTAGRARFDRLLDVYLDRLVPSLAEQESTRLRDAELSFAWAGGFEPGHGHYYRIQGPDLLIEYDNTQNGANHAHTVLRRPSSDFGDDVLAAHRLAAHE
jgi:hypothetical protein